ncbi:hypothetical protein MUK42_37552 [Musa troglodytarum]|uniref:Uncharacterized protein n=1 Tax=Musa troglodytarum TaxID=320322 RepID=A0A9E7JAJ8_9LILI|nr:hypothetical protein MUK42_37552 [Musa troglodytarum]
MSSRDPCRSLEFLGWLPRQQPKEHGGQKEEIRRFAGRCGALITVQAELEVRSDSTESRELIEEVGQEREKLTGASESY